MALVYQSHISNRPWEAERRSAATKQRTIDAEFKLAKDPPHATRHEPTCRLAAFEKIAQDTREAMYLCHGIVVNQRRANGSRFLA